MKIYRYKKDQLGINNVGEQYRFYKDENGYWRGFSVTDPNNSWKADIISNLIDFELDMAYTAMVQFNKDLEELLNEE